jgi:hypothetical protein
MYSSTAAANTLAKLANDMTIHVAFLIAKLRYHEDNKALWNTPYRFYKAASVRRALASGSGD